MEKQRKSPRFPEEMILWIGSCYNLKIKLSTIVVEMRRIFPDFGAEMNDSDYKQVMTGRVRSNARYYKSRANQDRVEKLDMGDEKVHLRRAELIWEDMEQKIGKAFTKPADVLKARSIQLAALKHASQYLTKPEPPAPEPSGGDPVTDDMEIEQGGYPVPTGPQLQDVSKIFGGIGGGSDLENADDADEV